MSIIRKSYDYTYAREKRSLIDLTLSENPLGCSPKIKQILKNRINSVHLYPGNEEDLISYLANRYKINHQDIMLGAGANQLLEDILTVYAVGKNIIVPSAHFPESVACMATIKGYAKTAPLTSNFSLDCHALLKKVDKKTAFIHICNPNNPTGIWTDLYHILKLADESPVPLLISEAGADFIGQTVLEHGVHKNIIVVRSFSKAYGLAGLRVGYVVAQNGCISKLKNSLGSYRVNCLAINAAIAALSDRDHLINTITYVLQEKTWLMEQMKQIGFDVIPSEGQTFIAKVPKHFKTAQDFCVYIKNYGIAVMDCGLYEGLKSYIRIVPQKKSINKKYISALKHILEIQDEK